MLTLNDGRSELWQWDTGRKLTVDAACSQVHFSNKVFGRSIDVDVVGGVAIIPDILLQTDKELTAWAFVGAAENGYTKISKVFKVNRRNKPADYVFTPTDQTTLNEILDRIEDLENRPSGDVSDEDIQSAVNDYLDKNPISVEETDPTVPEWAKRPEPPDVKIPDKLPNPYSITFTGAVNASYDGSSAVEIKIPDSGGNVDCLPKYSEADNGKVLGIVDGNPAWIEATISGGETPGLHGIVWDLANVTSSNNSVQVSDGASLVAVLTAEDGYILGDVTITMGGEVLTGVWNADTATVAITSVTGDVVVSCAGVEKSTGEVVDTSAKIAQYDVGLHTDGKAYDQPGLCITEPYDIPDGYVGKIAGLVASDGNTYSHYFQRLVYQDDTFKTYWSMQIFVNEAGSAPVTGGLYYEASWPANKVRFTLISATLDDSYMYFTDTGDIIFAGKNTPYYGMVNISDENALSVAEMVDNEIAMLSLPTGSEVSTTAYEGLDEAYVSMVRDNYNAMMGEVLGDYNKIPIIVHTDQHGRIGADNQVMKLIGDLVNWYEVSKCINLGDTVGYSFNTTELENYLAGTRHTIPLSKRLEVYGNHDIMDADEGQKYTVNQKRLSPYFKNIYARRRGNNGYFTVVDDYYNVKYLVINNWESKDTGDTTNKITPAQADFIISEMSADDGRDIILVSHIPFDSDDVISRDSTYIPYSEKFLTNTTAHNSFMAMLAARKNHTNGTFADSSGEEHAYDFGNVSGDLLMSLHGHAHFEAYRKFENSVTEFIFDMFAGNTFYFGYIDRENMKFKCWKNETGVEAMEISIA